MALRFQLSYPTAKMFMRRIQQKTHATARVTEIANVLVEVTLVKFDFVDVRPSIVAGSAFAIAWAAFGDLAAGRLAIRESCCTDLSQLSFCLRIMVTFLERIVRAREAMEGTAIHGMLAALDIAFDVDSLLL
jgi:hypothetical protein